MNVAKTVSGPERRRTHAFEAQAIRLFAQGFHIDSILLGLFESLQALRVRRSGHARRWAAMEPMNHTDQGDTPAKQGLPLQVRIHHCGVAILLVGLIVAALIYAFAADEGGRDPAAEIASGRVYEYNIERIGGMAAVYAARFNRWLAGLWHGRPLAYTVAVLTVAIALGCFWVAHLVSTPSANESDQEREG
jgi:hypothetical protein